MGRLRQLLIPRKSSNQTPDLDTNWRAIERWAQNVGGIQEITSKGGTVAITDPFGPVTNLEAAGAGGYASLTGPGQTVTPGALTQLGDFTVTVTSPLAASLAISSTLGRATVTGSVKSSLISTTAAGTTTVESQGAGGLTSISSDSATGTTQILGFHVVLGGGGVTHVGFYGNTGTIQPSVSGSRGGNLALASLLSALNAQGLIIDLTTP